MTKALYHVCVASTGRNITSKPTTLNEALLMESALRAVKAPLTFVLIAVDAALVEKKPFRGKIKL